MKKLKLLCLLFLGMTLYSATAQCTFDEKNGLVVIEAEELDLPLIGM